MEEVLQMAADYLTEVGFPPVDVVRESRPPYAIVAHYPRSMGVSGAARPARCHLSFLMVDLDSCVGMAFDR